jgi:hexosaminidase
MAMKRAGIGGRPAEADVPDLRHAARVPEVQKKSSGPMIYSSMADRIQTNFMKIGPQTKTPGKHFSLVAACLLLILIAPLSLRAGGAPPALIPAPRDIEWTGQDLDCSHYLIQSNEKPGFALAALRRVLYEAGAQSAANGAKITLRRAGIQVTNTEAYELEATTNGVVISASQEAGLFYGVQTLRQLIQKDGGKTMVAGCRITDWPAFAWRGFMHDVGRNFQDMALLKRFVDVMANYKMNVFHFHLTDNPGYRIECRVHPELNDPKNYEPTRSPGKFYTYAELNDFIDYCRQRGIMVVPEIDMPGHSAYFKRAFGVDMQDEKGMRILTDCLNEFFDNVNLPYFHMGADEVTVKNPDFMPRMENLIRSRGKQLIVWRPGNLPPGKVITQIWGDRDLPPLNLPALECRHDYVNHMDPFDGPLRVLSIAPCGVIQGNDLALGGILCHWPDNNVGDTMNIYRQSPVFPALLAAAERFWSVTISNRPDLLARLPATNDPAFAVYADFERRMIVHRDKFFQNWPFPYVKQTDIVWKLIGPFDYKGNIKTIFPVENEIRDEYVVDGQTYHWEDARGATIQINHFFDYPSWFPKRKSGTVYALTYIWSPKRQTVGFWIGFNDPSRSAGRRGGPNPAQGQWSNTGSQIWINGNEIAPPHWAHPGLEVDTPEIPFVDEGYFYRAPTQVPLNAGWNKVLIKAPKGEPAWKWMFTFVPVNGKGDQVREVPGLRFATSPAGL